MVLDVGSQHQHNMRAMAFTLHILHTPNISYIAPSPMFHKLLRSIFFLEGLAALRRSDMSKWTTACRRPLASSPAVVIKSALCGSNLRQMRANALETGLQLSLYVAEVPVFLPLHPDPHRRVTDRLPPVSISEAPPSDSRFLPSVSRVSIERVMNATLPLSLFSRTVEWEFDISILQQSRPCQKASSDDVLTPSASCVRIPFQYTSCSMHLVCGRLFLSAAIGSPTIWNSSYKLTPSSCLR